MSTEKRIIHGRTFGDLEMDHTRIEEGLNARLDKISPELQKKIQTLASLPDVYDRLALSIAPSIFENEDVKKAVLLQLFGGTNKTVGNSDSVKYR